MRVKKREKRKRREKKEERIEKKKDDEYGKERKKKREYYCVSVTYRSQQFVIFSKCALKQIFDVYFVFCGQYRIHFSLTARTSSILKRELINVNFNCS